MSEWGAGPAQVYRCFANDGECLYVGATVDLDARMVQHKTSTTWAWSVQDIRTTDHESLTAARLVEAEEIRALRPRWNIQGRGSRVNWTIADYVEVMLAVHSRRDELKPESADKKVEGLKRELRRRFPAIAGVVIADLAPHIVPASPERIAELEVQREVERAKSDHRRDEMRRWQDAQQNRVRTEDALSLAEELLARVTRLEEFLHERLGLELIDEYDEEGATA